VRRFYETRFASRVRWEGALIRHMRREIDAAALKAVHEAVASTSLPLLEIGPGDGFFLERLNRAPGRVLALDISRAILAKLPTGCARCQADAQGLPFRAGSIGVAHADSVLMFLDPDRTAVELRRVLASGGQAIIVEPLAGNSWLKAWRRRDPTYRGIAAWHPVDRIDGALTAHFRTVRRSFYYRTVLLALLPRPLRFLLRQDQLRAEQRPDQAWMGLWIATA